MRDKIKRDKIIGAIALTVGIVQIVATCIVMFRR